MLPYGAGFRYPFGFRVSIRVLGIRGFGFGDGLSLESVFGSGSGFDFGFQVWVHRDSTRSESATLPSLVKPPLRCGVWERSQGSVALRVVRLGGGCGGADGHNYHTTLKRLKHTWHTSWLFNYFC
jgi:hypothetical protein